MQLAIVKKLTNILPQKNRNFWLHISEGVFASFAGEIAPGAIIFPAIATLLGASPFMLGMLSSISTLSFILPLFAAPAVEAMHNKKKLVLMLGIGQRLPMILIPVLLLLFAKSHPMLCLGLMVVINVMSGAICSLLVPPWLHLIAETIPGKRVGRLFGYRNGISASLGLVSGGICGLILASYTFPINYSIVYFAGFISLAVSWLIFAFVDEVPDHVKSSLPRKPKAYFKKLIKEVKKDKTYRTYLLYQGMSGVSKASGPFYVLTAIAVYNMDPSLVAGSFIMVMAAARIIGSFLFPFVSDRIGYKSTIQIGILFHAAAAVMAGLAPNGYWFIGVMFLRGLGMATQTVSGPAFMMSICPSDKRIGYMTFSQIALAPISFVLFPTVGFIMQYYGHFTLFLIVSAAILASSIPLGRCKPQEAVVIGDRE